MFPSEVLIIFAAALILILVIVAIVIQCCYKRRTHSRDNVEYIDDSDISEATSDSYVTISASEVVRTQDPEDVDSCEEESLL
jgi:hypothetical protein